MATHKSAIKRHRQSIKRRDRNRTTKATIKAAVKKARAAIAAKSPEAKTLAAAAEKLLAKAAAKGVVKKNNAARRAGRLASQASRS